MRRAALALLMMFWTVNVFAWPTKATIAKNAPTITADFVSAINGQPAKLPAVKKLSASEGFKSAAKAIADSNGSLYVTASGARLCLGEGPALVCWEPTFVGEKVGFRFATDASEFAKNIFVATNPNDLKQIKKEFAAFIKKFKSQPAHSALNSFLFPSAQAQTPEVFEEVLASHYLVSMADIGSFAVAAATEPRPSPVDCQNPTVKWQRPGGDWVRMGRYGKVGFYIEEFDNEKQKGHYRTKPMLTLGFKDSKSFCDKPNPESYWGSYAEGMSPNVRKKICEQALPSMILSVDECCKQVTELEPDLKLKARFVGMDTKVADESLAAGWDRGGASKAARDQFKAESKKISEAFKKEIPVYLSKALTIERLTQDCAANSPDGKSLPSGTSN